MNLQSIVQYLYDAIMNFISSPESIHTIIIIFIVEFGIIIITVYVCMGLKVRNKVAGNNRKAVRDRITRNNMGELPSRLKSDKDDLKSRKNKSK